ncbi:unnamed protein product [Microthlaspi erraticum]|uniref:Uncharacterized protein n=1 Tax=Microthlaspi erraticum TaxID=1685480 RepID=A0A6D2I5K1_9BRAS|nr:unnamed protein product [Microthlaspi erraticum]
MSFGPLVLRHTDMSSSPPSFSRWDGVPSPPMSPPALPPAVNVDVPSPHAKSGDNGIKALVSIGGNLRIRASLYVRLARQH